MSAALARALAEAAKTNASKAVDYGAPVTAQAAQAQALAGIAYAIAALADAVTANSHSEPDG